MLKGYYLVNKSQDPILACAFCQNAIVVCGIVW
ncbi:hypothetical protein X275_10535 [Marinitoga sp. 1197]|nr:hypothetical protein X275_10535 [Marinitoga sp. 1197]